MKLSLAKEIWGAVVVLKLFTGKENLASPWCSQTVSSGLEIISGEGKLNDSMVHGELRLYAMYVARGNNHN